MIYIRGVIGILGLLFLAWLISTDRRKFPLKIVISGILLQWVLALAVLKTDAGRAVFDAIGRIVTTVLAGADAGARFVFTPFTGGGEAPWFANVAVVIATTIILVATLSSIGYHYGVLQRVVAMMAWVMRRTMAVSGAESLAAAANVFLGQTEAPLLVKPYISRMTKSELMALMTGGFATVAAGVMAVYVTMLGTTEEAGVAVARHLLTASLMSAPAAFIMAKIMVPEREAPETSKSVSVSMERETRNLVDAMTSGASQGMRLAINVIAMLIAFIAMIKLVDIGLGYVGRWGPVASVLPSIGLERLDLDGVLGLAFAPVAWLQGVDAAECRVTGGLLGKAMATNELIAYQSLSDTIKAGGLSPRAATMAIYSLCGFANISSIGIQIGGIGELAPDRRGDLVRLGPRAMLGGAMACWMTGTIAGMLIG